MNRILFVDDEPNILDAYRRTFYSRYDFIMTDSGAAALDIIVKSEPFHVIVTDYKMPVMNGVELLNKVRILSPETIQIMLTGQAEMQAVIDLINKGKIFRFLTKPCAAEDMIVNIDDALRQYELITAEKELLGRTLSGSLKVLMDLLALAKPQAFTKTQRIRSLARLITGELVFDNKWQIEIAATLSQIGCVTIPDDILKKVYKGFVLSEGEDKMFSSHPSIGADMIMNIPRLDKVADIIRYQEKNFDGSGFPADEIKEDMIPAGSRILKIVLDYDKAVSGGAEPQTVLHNMKIKPGLYDPAIFAIAEKKFLNTGYSKACSADRELKAENLREGMFLAEDLVTADGMLIGNKNQKITMALIASIKNHVGNAQLKDAIKVISAES
jgi:response regulator RpfG family c-di-GMP phosphodiesterase